MQTKPINDQLKHLAWRTKFFADQFIRAEHEYKFAAQEEEKRKILGKAPKHDLEALKRKLERTRSNYSKHIKNHMECIS